MPAKPDAPGSHGRRTPGKKVRDAAIAQLRQALAEADRGARADLRARLAVALSNRGVARAEEAVPALAPDEATRRMVAMDRALEYLRTGKPPGGRRRRPGARRHWARPRLELSWSEVLAWLVLLSPFWVPSVLWAVGWISEETAGAIAVLGYLFWFGVQAVSALVTWVKSLDPMRPAAPVIDRSVPCDVARCSEPGQYEMRRDQLVGGSELAALAWGGGTWRLCAQHAHGLEEVLNAPMVSPRALQTLLEAKADLEEAVRLAPRQPTARENLAQVKKIVAQLRAQGIDTSVAAGGHR